MITMKDLHQQFTDILNWSYPDFSSITNIYTDWMKERNEAEKEHQKEQEAEMQSKTRSMQNQYSAPKIPNMPSIPNFSNLSNFKI